ncbi:MAG: sulfite exporter TauE/SafE family protein [Candidatus Rokubacteria bacterium]|nr:sulfite exporter TauE/SafE family protein [Candidatus Rokubacteria bacterium]
MDSLLPAALLGVVLGLQHATDGDHLVAVATIVSRERRFGEGALVGTLWGIGHTATLTAVGLLVVALDLAIDPGVVAGLDLLVAAMLVALGVWRLTEAARGLGAVSPDHLVADHDHDGREVLHSHAHTHGTGVHAHPHVHPSRRLVAALTARRRGGLRPLAVGAVHGMAGSAAILLLVLATTRSPWAATLYLALFGLGTIVGMTALTAAMAYPLGLVARFERARRALAVAAGLASIAFGLFYGWRLV